MTDFLAKYKSRYEGRKDTLSDTLDELIMQLNTEWREKSITVVRVTTTGDLSTYITHAIHFNVPVRKSGYTYRFIEIKQPVDAEFPVTVSAFQNPPTEPVEFSMIGQFKGWLVDTLGDVRTRIITEHLTMLNANYSE